MQKSLTAQKKMSSDLLVHIAISSFPHMLLVYLVIKSALQFFKSSLLLRKRLLFFYSIHGTLENFSQISLGIFKLILLLGEECYSLYSYFLLHILPLLCIASKQQQQQVMEKT